MAAVLSCIPVLPLAAFSRATLEAGSFESPAHISSPSDNQQEQRLCRESKRTLQGDLRKNEAGFHCRGVHPVPLDAHSNA